MIWDHQARFPNPCPVCDAGDDHAERMRATLAAGFGATVCPHPEQPGHGTGCCCAGMSAEAWRKQIEVPPPPPLTPDQVRQLLSECVTVVKPGDVLILRGAEGMTPRHVREIHDAVSRWLEYNAPEIRAIVVPPMEIAIVPAGEAGAMTRGGFLNDCRVDTFRNSAETSFRITHLPTGVKAEGGWDEAVADLGRDLLQRGDVTLNDARGAMGLLPFGHLDGD